MFGRFHVGIREKILGGGMTTGRFPMTLSVLWTFVLDSREKAFLPMGVKTQRTAQGLTKEENCIEPLLAFSYSRSALGSLVELPLMPWWEQS
jgi:hypothetical protein